MNDLDLHSRSQHYEKAETCAIIVVNWHELSKTFAVVNNVREMTSKKTRRIWIV